MRVNRIYQLVIWLVIFWQNIAAWAQQPEANFVLPPTICLNQNPLLENLSTNADAFQWDFCIEDYRNLESSTTLQPIPGLSGGGGYKLVKDLNGDWFGFVVGQNSNSLHRLSFGNSPQNTPVITSLGNPGGLLNQPQGIEIVSQDGIWYGFVGAIQADAGITKLVFGNSLSNTPTGSNLGVFGISGGRFWDIRAIKHNNDWILVTTNRDANSVVRINFRNSFNNSINNTSDVFDTGSVPGADLPLGFDVAFTGSKWIVVLPSYFGNSVQVLNFGNNLLGSFTSQGIYTFPSINRPYNLRLVREGNIFAGFINNESSTLSIIDFKDFDAAQSPQEVNVIGLPIFRASSVVRWDGKTIMQGINNGLSFAQSLVFRNVCGASFELSEAANPQNFTYLQAGVKYVELIATQTATQQVSYTMQKTIVSNLLSPDISFTTQNQCALHAVNFTSQNDSGDIDNYLWEFGDGQTATVANPSHIYSSAGTFQVLLTVTAVNGCQNVAQTQRQLFNPPVVDFNIPSPAVVCTNQSYEFENASTYDQGSGIAWGWQINGIAQSSNENLSAQFFNPGSYQIKLTGVIPGCMNEISKNFNVTTSGPQVDFTATGNCAASPVEFTSSITGQFNSLQWNFGDGATSTLEDPSHNYIAIGNYDVQLTAINAAGCQNSTTKSLTIRSKPQPDFSLALPPFSCAGSASQFTDLTASMPDSNVNGWAWTFGDAAQGTSTIKNATYSYHQAGDYLVALAVTTNFGCTASIEKIVTISPSPTAAFTNAAACMSQGTLFTDVSGTDIKAWLWTMQSSTYTTKNPTHIFSATGQHPVTLAVTANNNCVSQIEKSITVPVPVSINFMATSTCATLPTTFTETTVSGSDPAVAWSWDFSGTTGNGSPIQHTFTNVGTYPVKLSSTRQSGCTYSVTKSIAIIQPPVASFTVPFTSGPAPLTVGFTNTSTQASSYLWKFNDSDNSTSTAFSPSFVFEELGAYPVELVASNVAGCSDSFVTDIQVVVPNMNAAITDFVLSPNPDGTWRGIVTIENRSNMAITNPEVFIDLAGRTQIKERVTATLQPNQIYTQQISTDFIESNLSYVCAEVRLPNDVYAFDDSQCATLTNESIALAPYPNPVSDELNLNWINQGDEQLRITIFNSGGQIVMDQEFNPLLPELNQVKVDVSGLKTGIYYVTFKTGSRQSSHRFAVVR